MVRHAVIYYTHFVSSSVVAEIERLQRELNPDFSLFAMGCCSDKSTLDVLASPVIQVRSYDRDDLRVLPYERQLENVDWKTLRRNPDLAIMRFFRGNPDFDYYWIVEYDVRYSGDWGTLFNDLTKSRAALLCSHLTTQRQNPDWMHWGSFVCGDGSIKSPDLVRAFLPFARLSRELMRAIDERCRAGWAGHPEVLWPTIAAGTGMSIEEIGGLGAAVPPERRGKYYYSAISPDGLFFSTFTAWPYFSEKSNFNRVPSLSNILWHPVKE